MSILEAVIILAGVIKQVADDSMENAAMVKSLVARVETVPRILKKIPETNELDPDLLNRMHEILKDAHKAITKYHTKGIVKRLFTASSMKTKFSTIEASLSRCIDDLSFNVGITSASVLEGIRSDLSIRKAEDTPVAEDTLTAMEPEEEEMDLSGFDELTTHLENLSSAVKVFGAFECLAQEGTGTGNSSPAAALRAPAPAVVLLGDKVILHNFQKPKEQTESQKIQYVEYEEETGAANVAMPSPVANPGNNGTIVFHIDNTSSMLRDKRMELTKAVLSRVIPNFLRQGFRIVVNAWASTNENRGRIETREVSPDPEVLQALLGGVTAVEGTEGQDAAAQLQAYLDNKVYDILVPKGRTDLYGSCYQLLRQCATLRRSRESGSVAAGPVYAFVLTDGEHNKLDAPLHRPCKEGEDYFGVYAAKPDKGRLKFERNGAQPSVALCEQFLRRQLESMNGQSGDGGATAGVEGKVSITLIGIGEAETQPLSSLASTLGGDEQGCAFYGITEVGHSDAVFQNISAVSSDIHIVCDSSSTGKLSLPLKYTYEDQVVGAVVTLGTAPTVADLQAVQQLHQSTALTVQVPNPSSTAGTATVTLSAVTDLSAYDRAAKTGSKNVDDYHATRLTTAELFGKVGEFVSEIRKIRATAYEVNADSFGTVFRQLLADKKSLQTIKASFLSKHTRRLRQYSAFSALGVWINELENLIETQLASYRMNVEGEVLSRIAQQEQGYLQPTQLVLYRLQNNLSNAGRSTHKVMRHVAAISNIRERTLHIAGTLFSTQLSVSYLDASTTVGVRDEGTEGEGQMVGVRLTVQRSGDSDGDGGGKVFHVDWKIDAADSSAAERVAQIVRACLEVGEAGTADDSARSNHLLYSLARGGSLRKTGIERSLATVVFPCVLLHARFDQFSIIRSTYVFFLTDIYCATAPDATRPGHALNAAVYCAQEVWELCHASNHIVGEPLPLACLDRESAPSKRRPNMILPLAYTPLLFSLYVERGRAYHSAVNVTADCMALTVASLQWAKVYHDVMLFVTGAEKHLFTTTEESESAHRTEKLRVLVDQALKAAVALSYSIDSMVMLPSKAGLNAMFGYDAVSPTAISAKDTTVAAPTTPAASTRNDVIISREDCAGLTCSIALAALVAGAHLPYSDAPASWNVLLRTLYSRLAEAISGTKIIRTAKPASPQDTSAVPKDPGAFEHEYRLKLGELQGLLGKRLNTEWPKCSAEQKRIQVQASAEALVQCLRDIAILYLNRLDECGLQSWAQACNAVRLTLLLKQFGIQQLRSAYNACEDLTPLVQKLLTAGADYTATPITLPVCEATSTAGLTLRELTATDTDHIILYIDALVATKAAPKVEYEPVLNPNFPTYSAADSRAASVQHATVEWNEALPSVNIAFIGNVNSGKSSISGILLSCLQIVPEAAVARLGKEAGKLGLTEDLKHAWVMDRLAHERRGGFTITPSWAGFQTPSRRYTIIDNPGHKDFCRNAAFGVFEADAVVLVMPADIFGGAQAPAGAETAADPQPPMDAYTNTLVAQVEEHLVTAFCFGVRELVVAVNKMDKVDYSQDAFEAVRGYTLKLLKKAGFKPESATFVPVSVLHGQGFLSVSERVVNWYSGPCLLQACDDLPLPRRVIDKPLRMVVDDVVNCKFRKGDAKGTAVLCGKLERGVVSLQDEVTLYPQGPVRAKVQSIQLHGTPTHEARAGDNVGILIAIDGGNHPNAKKLSPSELAELVRPKRGCVLTLSAQPAVTVMHRFEAQLLVMRGTAIAVGYKPALTTHLVTASVHITRLVEIIGRSNAVLETKPAAVKVGQTVVCEMTALRPFAAETIHDMPRLSRFLIKENCTVMAIGFIRRVLA